MNDIIFINNNKQDIVIAWTVALLVHVLFFSLTGKMFIKPSQFAISPTREIDINLIDEPREVVKVQEEARPVVKKAEKIIPKIPKPTVKVIEKVKSITPKQLIEPKQIGKTVEKPKQIVVPKHLVNYKQVVVPSTQVRVEAKPDYIQNPPPPYPDLAKQMRQEGIVMLSVDVNKEGDPVDVEIIQSSGFRLLDQAAVKAVRHWKFQPGRVGDIAIESKVEVPIRFRLQE